MDQQMTPLDSVRPQSDPSALTTESLLREITHLRELVEERFRSVDQQFLMKDTAVQAALAAAKEAVAKNEEATEKQIDRILETIAALDRSHAAQVMDLKERLDRGDGTGSGKSQTWAVVVAIIGAIAVILGIVATLGSLSKG